MTLFPVVLPVTDSLLSQRGRERVAMLSRCARQALRLSADKAGMILQDISKDADDIPLPSGSYHWSVSHKPKYVAAVISGSPAGIDIEEVRPRKRSIFSYVAGDEEWELCGGQSWDALYRIWTAKEAVVKAAGTGLAGMRACRVVSVPDESQMLLFYQDSLHTVEQLRFNGHVVAVLRGDNDIEWTFPAASSGPTVPDSTESPSRQRF